MQFFTSAIKSGFFDWQNLPGGYRYGFQGQEEDDEIKGDGNSVNYKYRMHDPRIGRFFAVDPLTSKYPHYSPYSFSGNRVIDMIELEGLEPIHPESGKKMDIELYYDFVLWVDWHPEVPVFDEEFLREVKSFNWIRAGDGNRGNDDEYDSESEWNGDWEDGWGSTGKASQDAVVDILGHDLYRATRPTDNMSFGAATTGTYVLAYNGQTERIFGMEVNDYYLYKVEGGVIQQAFHMTRGDCDECDFYLTGTATWSTQVEYGTTTVNFKGTDYNVAYEKTILIRTNQDYTSDGRPLGASVSTNVKTNYKVMSVEQAPAVTSN